MKAIVNPHSFHSRWWVQRCYYVIEVKESRTWVNNESQRWQRDQFYTKEKHIKFDYVNSHFKILYSSLLFLNFKKLSLKFLSRSLGHLPASFLLTVLIMLPSPFHCIHTKRISVPRFASRPFRVLPTPQSTGPLAYFLAHFHTLASSPVLREAFAALADEVCPPSLSNADHSYGSCLSCSPLCLQIQAQQWELYDYNSNHLSHKDLHFAEWPTSLFPPLGQPYLLLLPEMFAPFPQLFV